MSNQQNEKLEKAHAAQKLHKLLGDYKKTQDKKIRDQIVDENFNLVKKIAHGLA